jgi:hypothetical protein
MCLNYSFGAQSLFDIGGYSQLIRYYGQPLQTAVRPAKYPKVRKPGFAPFAPPSVSTKKPWLESIRYNATERGLFKMFGSEIVPVKRPFTAEVWNPPVMGLAPSGTNPWVMSAVPEKVSAPPFGRGHVTELPFTQICPVPSISFPLKFCVKLTP